MKRIKMTLAPGEECMGQVNGRIINCTEGDADDLVAAGKGVEVDMAGVEVKVATEPVKVGKALDGPPADKAMHGAPGSKARDEEAADAFGEKTVRDQERLDKGGKK